MNRFKENKHILNLSFGKKLDNPLEFKWFFPEIGDLPQKERIYIRFKIFNNSEMYINELELEKYHTIENKQTINYNPRASNQTGVIQLNYPDLPVEYLSRLNEEVNGLFQYDLSSILSFFQRRRIIVGSFKLKSSENNTMSFPMFSAGELIDSISYGNILITNETIFDQLNKALNSINKMSMEERSKINMLLMRYNNTRNLPYTFERVESYWRIVESIGSENNLNSMIESEYTRFQSIIGIKNGSKNLKKFLSALLNFRVDYTDDEVINAFKYRNKVTHEYLNRELLNDPNMGQMLIFLNKSVELIISKILDLDTSKIIQDNFMIVEDRIL